MLRVLAITGDQPRHRYIVERLQDTGFLVGWIAEEREHFIPTVPDELTNSLQKLYLRHFTNRANSENYFFIPKNEIVVPKSIVTREDLNTPQTMKLINDLTPDLVISYGCHKLSSELISSCEANFWNTHGGLSPEYRGVITHFWPSYNLEPQMTGMTLHQTTSAIDGGDIFHQSAANLVSGDGIHELAARAVINYGDSLPRIMESIAREGFPIGVRQTFSGKVYRNSDWRPEHLKLIYDQFEDKIVDLVLSGDLEGRIPLLVSAF
jgi:folate-dependent phosphoribosylglycinamide formyltransferase PurN